MAKGKAPAFNPALQKGPIHKITQPLRKFLIIESSSGVLLFLCALAALILANSVWAEWFDKFWHTPLRLGIGPATDDNPFHLEKDLHFWVNDVLMTLFFFVVGLEIKRELVNGELSSPQKAMLPAVAALGGMVVPALVYILLAPKGDGFPPEVSRGWGIPMATDIAFVVGVLALFGPSVPFGFKIFLLALAIVDDIGAILVIAVFYSGSPDFIALALAVLGFLFIYGMNRLGVRTVGVYVFVGAFIWLAVYRSGIHPTIAGVLLGLLTPGSAWVGKTTLLEAMSDTIRGIQGGQEVNYHTMKQMAFAARESLSPLERLETGLHPWVAFLIMPAFALANAGVPIDTNKFTNPVAHAVGLGLLVGKPLGIFLFCYVAVKIGLCQLPSGVNFRMLLAGGFLAGIGFTMSLFINELAFYGEDLYLLKLAGKVGILFGSLASMAIGSLLLWSSIRKAQADSAEEQS